MTAPAVFSIPLRYRDGGGFKEYTTVAVVNDKAMSLKDFVDYIDNEIGNEDIVGAQWGFYSPSPVKYEWECGGDYHHCYLTISGEIDAHDALTDIEEIDTTVTLSALMATVDAGGTEEYLRDAQINRERSMASEKRTALAQLKDSDDADLLNAAVQMLIKQGYRVVKPEDAQPALALFQAPHDVNLDMVARIAYGAMAESSLRPHIIDHYGRATVDAQCSALSRWLGL